MSQHKSERAGQRKYKFCCNIQCVPNVMGFGWVIQCILSSLLNTGSSIFSPLASRVCALLTTQTVYDNFVTGKVHSAALVLPVPLTPALNGIQGFALLKCKPELIILLLFHVVKCGNWNLLVGSVLFTACPSGTEVVIVILPEIHCWTALPRIAKSQTRTRQSKSKLCLNTCSWQVFQYYVLELKFWTYNSIDQVWVWGFCLRQILCFCAGKYCSIMKVKAGCIYAYCCMIPSMSR